MSIEREVGEIHVKVDHLLELVKTQNGRVTKLEDKVGSIRRWQAWALGLFTTAGTGAGATIVNVWDKLSH